MEIHHAHIEKKNFKEYLLEGLMIFIAVTVGFFAENLREHITDSQRESDFAKTLYAEFYDDSVVAANKLDIRIQKEKTLDFLAAYIADSSLVQLPDRFYPALTMGLYITNIYAFEPRDGILTQLKNSGSLRYFKNVALQKLLGDMSVSINNVRLRNEQEYQFFADPIKHFLIRHYDFNWINSIRTSETNVNILKAVSEYMTGGKKIPASLVNMDSFDRKEATNMISFWRQLMISTRTLQLNDYFTTNHKVLEELRRNYDVQ